MTRNQLINDTKELLDRQEAQLERLIKLPTRELWQKPGAKAWSAMECLEHLVLAGRYYAKEIHQELEQAVLHRTHQELKSGRVGKMMTKGQAPTADGRRRYKTKTFASTTPLKQDENRHQLIVEDYLALQQDWRDLLVRAQEVDWNKIRIRSLAGPVLRFYLGDTFQFMLAHQARHLLQAEEAVGSRVGG